MLLSVQQFYEVCSDALGLSVENGERYLKNTIHEESVNRPGLALAGFFQYFAHRRMQVFGLAEYSYLKSLSDEERLARLKKFFEKHVPCLVLTRNRHAFPEMIELSSKFRVPVLRTSMITGKFINAATLSIEKMVAPRTRVQGTMVDIMGIGVLIEGEPGVGKSETALSLIERGHSLVADDIALLRLEGTNNVVASAAEITKYHMEIRGLGIVHVPSLFGIGSLRGEKRLDVIVRLHHPGPAEESDRTGLVPEMRDVLGVEIPVLSLPVAPGRSMANVVEVAALNQKLKALGHDAAKELDAKVVNLLAKKGGVV